MSTKDKKVVSILTDNDKHFNLERLLYDLGNIMKKDIDLHLIAGKRTPTKKIAEYYDIFEYDVPSIDRYNLTYSILSLHRYLKKNNTDLILNAGKPLPLGLAVSIIGKLYGIPSLVRMTGDNLYSIRYEKNIITRFRKDVVYSKICRSIYDLADHIVAVGENIKSSVVEKGIRESKVSVLPQPFDSSRFSSSKREGGEKEKLGLGSWGKIIMYVGSLSYIKGADRLVEIIKGVIGKRKDIGFCVLGNGPYAGKLSALPEGAVVGPKTVSHTRMPDYFRAADLLIHPTRRDGLPNVILEALASELPIIASPVGEIPEYVSTTAEEPRTYVNHILRENWSADPKPDWFDRDVQRRRYLETFSHVAHKNE